MNVNKIATQDSWDCQAWRYIEAHAPYQPTHLNVELNNVPRGNPETTSIGDWWQP
jgi:hypothetical protein